MRQTQAEQRPDIARLAPLMAKALPHIAHPAIRNRGTIGGSIAFADPAAELPACLVALEGDVEMAGPRGRRSVTAERILHGPVRDRAGSRRNRDHDPRAGRGHRIAGSALPNWRAGMATTRSSGLPPRRARTAAALHDVRLVYFGVGAMPMRARHAEKALAEGTIDDAVAVLAKDLDPSGRCPHQRAGQAASRRRAAQARGATTGEAAS